MTQVNGTVGSRTETPQQQAPDVKAAAAEHVGAVADQAKARAGDVVHQVRGDLEARGDEQAKKFASVLRDTGSQLHSMADAGGQGLVVDMTRGLADGSERLASRLDGGGLQAVGEDIRGFARRSPGLFLAGAAMAGFLVSRLVRNSDRSALTNGQSQSASSQSASSQSASSPSPVAPLGTEAGMPSDLSASAYPVGSPAGGQGFGDE